MSDTLHPVHIDTRAVLRGYAALMLTAGGLAIFWGPLWFGTDLGGVPWLQAALIRILGSVAVAAGCSAVALGNVPEPEWRRQGLLWFAIGHGVVAAVAFIQWQALLGVTVAAAFSTLALTAALLLSLAWQFGEGADGRLGRVLSIFGYATASSTQRLRSDYEREHPRGGGAGRAPPAGPRSPRLRQAAVVRHPHRGRNGAGQDRCGTGLRVKYSVMVKESLFKGEMSGGLYELAYVEKLETLIEKVLDIPLPVIPDRFFSAPQLAAGNPRQIAETMYRELDEIRRPATLMVKWLETRDDQSLVELIAPKSVRDLGHEPVVEAQVEKELEALTFEDSLRCCRER